MDVLLIVKSKLLEPKPTDSELLPLIGEVEQTILNYCNLQVVPPQLNYVHANMVVDLLNHQTKVNSEEEQTSVSSIKEGDVTVQFGAVRVETSEQAMKGLLFNYKEQLNRFRKLRW